MGSTLSIDQEQGPRCILQDSTGLERVLARVYCFGESAGANLQLYLEDHHLSLSLQASKEDELHSHLSSTAVT